MSVLDQFNIEGRVAIITGGSRGIGFAIAEGFAALGAKVVIASRKADACQAAADKIAASGGDAIAVPTHVGDDGQLKTLVEVAAQHYGSIDIIVNNAANPLAMPIGSITPEAFTKSLEVNLQGPLYLVQHALPYLRESKHASVINMITAGIYTGGGYVTMYVAAKNGLMMLTRSMAAELIGDGIRVNAIAPGTIRTDMVLAMPEDFQQMAVDTQLIKRMGEPEEIVPAALYLASDASSFMTGQALVVDGGLSSH